MSSRPLLPRKTGAIGFINDGPIAPKGEQLAWAAQRRDSRRRSGLSVLRVIRELSVSGHEPDFDAPHFRRVLVLFYSLSAPFIHSGRARAEIGLEVCGLFRSGRA